MFAKSSFKGTYVVRRGEISKFATIGVISTFCSYPGQTLEARHHEMRAYESADTIDLGYGSQNWSKSLEPYRGGGYRAEVRGDDIAIMDVQGDLAEVIPGKAFYPVILPPKLHKVHTDGCLIRSPGDLADLALVARGLPPRVLDNGDMFRVSPEHVGRNLVLFSYLAGDQQGCVYTPEGIPVPCTVDKPFSYAKWDSTGEKWRAHQEQWVKYEWLERVCNMPHREPVLNPSGYPFILEKYSGLKFKL